MEDAGQFDQQVNGAAALSVLHAADMLLACQAQENRQFLLRNATGSAIWAGRCAPRRSGCRQRIFSMQSALRGTAAGSAKQNN